MNLPLVTLAALVASVLASGLLVGGVALLSRMRTVDAKARHALWFATLVVIALLPVAGIATSLARATHAQGAAAAVAPATSISGTASTSHTGASNSRSRHSTGGPTAASPSHVAGGASAIDRATHPSFLTTVSASVAMTVLIALGFGALVGLISLIVGLARVASVKRRSSPLDESLSSDLPWLTATHDGRETYLRLSYEIETPVAIGFGRPVILIPTDLATHSGLQAIEDLVVHEYAHLARFDDYTNLAQRLIERIFWFNPFVWIAGRRIALEREIAADDAVVARTANSARYAEALWRLAREMRMPTHALVAPGALFTRKQISVRIEALLAPGRARLRGLGPASSGIAAAFALASFAIVALAAPPLQLPATPQQAAQALPQAPAHTAAQTMLPHQTVPALPHQIVKEEHTVTTTGAAPSQAEQQRLARIEADDIKLRDELDRAQRAAQSATHAANAAVAAVPKTPQTSKVAAVPGVNVVVPSIHVNVPGTHVDVPGMNMTIPKMQIKAKMPAMAMNADEDSDRSGAGTATPWKSAQTKKIAFSQSTQISRDLLARCTGCDLSGRDLHGLDLHGLTLTGIDLSGANLSGANLSGANLTGADLRNANLNNADLTNAKITGADIAGASFKGARMTGTEFTGISLRHGNFDNGALRALLVHGCTGCDLSHMDLHGVDFHGVTMTGSDFAHSDLSGANFSGAKLSGVSFDGAKLDRADFRNASLVGCSLNGASLNGAQLEGISLSGTSLGRDP